MKRAHSEIGIWETKTRREMVGRNVGNRSRDELGRQGNSLNRRERERRENGRRERARSSVNRDVGARSRRRRKREAAK